MPDGMLMIKKIKDAIKYAIKIKKLYDKTHIAAYSAQAAFFVLVSAVPLVAFGVVVSGMLVPYITESLVQWSRQLFTPQAEEWLVKTLQEISAVSAAPVLSPTTVFLAWSATRGVRSIADAISSIYGSKDEYNIVQTAARSIVYAVGLVAAVAVSLFIMVAVMPWERRIRALLGDRGDMVLLVVNSRSVIIFSALVLMFAFAYKGLARSDIPLKNHFGGAVLAALGWMGYSFGYSVYIQHFSRVSIVYGGLGAVMLFMLWLYMCMNILLCGALFNRLRADREKCD